MNRSTRRFSSVILFLLVIGCVSSTSCNRLWGRSNLRNDYFALRHGQSLANVEGIIASNPEVACNEYGLSDMGMNQARSAGKLIAQVYMSSITEYKGILVVSSDLLRAKETADCVADAAREASIPLYNDTVVIDKRLRERGFGSWDFGSDKHYRDVWQDDAIDPTHEVMGVESVSSVIERATECIVDWDERAHGYFVICVAHGDVLQILQTAFNKIDGSLHRSLDHLETAVLRSLKLAEEPGI